MTTGWIVFLLCLVFVLGAALPLINDRRGGKAPPPPPRKETLRDWRHDA